MIVRILGILIVDIIATEMQRRRRLFGLVGYRHGYRTRVELSHLS